MDIFNKSTFLLVYIATILAQRTVAQLVVNVKNKGGEIVIENINANVTDDTIILEFQKSDGTYICQFIDFKSGVQIFKSLVLGEEERGQSQYQVMCFITRFINNEFISSDAMSKLRQKNPSAIRHPEDDKGREPHQKDLLVNSERSHLLSPHINKICNDAKESTYTSEADLKAISHSTDREYYQLSSATHKLQPYTVPKCNETAELWRSCLCSYEICIGWYPCGLKYCKGKDSAGKIVSYRCGIKTCQKCRMFQYYVKQKLLCLWDDNNL
ncbi:unnamed protein product [Owenia fusiformis]|uniref:Out at first protein n=1 Tax=Owenia fusiformis TaxID=6347 RepID=A0A8S4PVB4_OWEFU|nr:unnamed protein product [Owenia fusiformis]